MSPDRITAAQQARLETISATKRALLAKRLARHTPVSAGLGETGGPVAPGQATQLTSEQREGPMSFEEERFWAAYLLEDQSPAYHVPLTLRLEGMLDVGALTEALKTVCARHSILRTRYRVGPAGDPVAVVDDSRPISMEVLAADPDPRPLIERLSAAPFDLEADPLLRAFLLRSAEEEHYLHLTFHHLVTDAWSMGILLHELTMLYSARVRGVEPSLSRLSAQYRDHARWQRGQAERFARQSAYWREALAGASTELGLPADRPRPAQRLPQVPGRCFTVTVPQQPALALAQQTGTTLFMVLLAAYSAVLGRRAGRSDVVVGTPVAGRLMSSVEPLIGCFVNTLAMRTDLSGDPAFSKLLIRVREWTLRAYDHQDVPFQQVVAALGERPDARASHFQAWLALQNVPDRALEMEGLAVEELADVIEATKFDVTLHVSSVGDQLELRIEYDTSLFEESTVRGLVDEFAALLSAAAAEPERRLSELFLYPRTDTGGLPWR